MRAFGHWFVLRREAESGKPIGLKGADNTITSDGKGLLLDLMFGTNSPSSSWTFDNTRAKLDIYNQQGQLVKTLNCATGYPSHGNEDSGVAMFRFDDISVDVYDAYRVELRNNATGLVFSSVAPTGFGTKPASENWEYYYTITIDNGLDSSLTMDAMDHTVRLFTGNRQLTGNQWTRTDSRLRVRDQQEVWDTSLMYDGGYPARSGTSVTIVTTAESNEANHEWYTLSIHGTFTDFDVVLSQWVENAGTKTSTQEWIYTFTISF